MYDAVDQLGEGKNWWELWASRVGIYADLGKYTPAQLSALSMLYKHFQTATMDFVQLMRIDLSAAMRCDCEHPFTNLVADGITVSCQTRDLHIAAPFAPSADDSTLVWGSKFPSRIFIADKKVRASLRVFAQEGSAGLNTRE